MSFYREPLEKRVIKAKSDSRCLNDLINDFKPFIASVAQKKAGRYLNFGIDEELSVGLMAFKEAVDSYQPDRGKFLSFARMVISLRLIDFFRKHSKVPDEDFLEEIKDTALAKQSVQAYRLADEEEDRKAEVIEYKALLLEWGISLDRLVNISPKQERLKKTYQEIAKRIANDRQMLDFLMETQRLPVKLLRKKIPIHRNKLERGRIYIIAMVLAIVSGFSYIKF